MPTGNDVLAMRRRLGLDVQTWSKVVGVAPSTAWRWESKGEEETRMDPLQRDFVTVLFTLLDGMDAAQTQEFGESIRVALVGHGALKAWWVVLDRYYRPPAGEKGGGR